MRFLLFITGIIVAAIAGVWAVEKLLIIDDLKNCSAPDPLLAQCAPAEAIIVVSGGDTAGRTAEAIRLYKAGWAPKLLVSGAALDLSGPSNAEAMRRQAVDAGVPQNDILTDHVSQNTSANAANAANLLKNPKRIIVVTSPYHQRRATLAFQHAFSENTEVLSHPNYQDSGWSSRWWATPLGWWLAISETVKTLFIWIMP